MVYRGSHLYWEGGHNGHSITLHLLKLISENNLWFNFYMDSPIRYIQEWLAKTTDESGNSKPSESHLSYFAQKSSPR
ncbi:hypothetical protein EYZ11_011194 [Aspergillus tanneri]|uniref:Uncharacterized protein n=1 Tax=Aspergillus tanneri TaxID=1220188 RepID=A0A4S3J3R3_9EURO|nr:hypothetical protein EYZ11_011194 [Aspergillus tanneri]